MRSRFGDGSRWGVKLTYSYEEELLGTAGGIKKLESEFAGEDFLVISGDALTDLDLTALMEYHRSREASPPWCSPRWTTLPSME